MASVLVVDDARVSRRVLAALLRSLGHDVVAEAQSLQEAVAACIRAEPDVVFVDLGLIRDGVAEALDRIRDVRPTARILACAPFEERDGLRRAMGLGASGGILRPFVRSHLLNALR